MRADLDQLSSMSDRPDIVSNMHSTRNQVMAALDAVKAGQRELASLPLDALSRPEKQQLLKELEELEKKMKALDRRLIGQLISDGDPAVLGGASWADVLSRRLRISPGEAQQRIAEARSA
jgi:hypothetical protein